MDEAFEALEPGKRNSGDDAKLGDRGIEEPVVVDIADEEFADFALLGIEIRGAELLHEMLLKSDWLYERIHHELVALACFSSAGGVLLSLHALILTPVVIKG